MLAKDLSCEHFPQIISRPKEIEHEKPPELNQWRIILKENKLSYEGVKLTYIYPAFKTVFPQLSEEDAHLEARKFMLSLPPHPSNQVHKSSFF